MRIDRVLRYSPRAVRPVTSSAESPRSPWPGPGANCRGSADTSPAALLRSGAWRWPC